MQDYEKRIEFKKLMVLIIDQLNKNEFVEVQRTMLKAIELFDAIPKRYDRQDLTVEMKSALEDVRTIIVIKLKIFDKIEMAKINVDMV